jgi:UDP-GlcNAc3NAcA epimerase
VLTALGGLDLLLVLPLHPRTRAVLETAAPGLALELGLDVVALVSYLESLALTRAAAVVVTDSGGLQREAYWLGVPYVTLRRETEWQETVELGANLALDPTAVTGLGTAAGTQRRRWAAGPVWDRTTYGNGNAAAGVAAVVRALLAA